MKKTSNTRVKSVILIGSIYAAIIGTLIAAASYPAVYTF